MRALDSASRAAVAASAFAAFAGAFAGVPLGAREAGSIVATPATPAAARRDPPFAVALPRRDPFAGGDDSPRAPATLAPAVSIPAALGPLPPNAGAGGAPFPIAAERLQVRAVTTGPHPFALVEDGGATRLVTLGDMLAGDTIAAIAADGVRLAHGRMLRVTPAAATPADPEGVLR